MGNQLLNSKSLYLQQHAHNPVNWYPWTDAAFQKSKEENKPIIISIGYAACHWCHVMERESFENENIAAFMNQHFVCIKVDREEHPAVDHLYMDALHAMNQQGGWPLNVFVTPDLKPFYGGTYFPPKPLYGRLSWTQVLESIANMWREKNSEIVQQAEQLSAHLLQMNTSLVSLPSIAQFDTELAIKNLLSRADIDFGGFGSAPKFPSTMSLRFLIAQAKKYPEALQHSIFTLRKMLSSGIYDAVGGGLCRYATDNDWMIPHFEKMLYDNALILLVLTDTYAITGDNFFLDKIKDIITFATKELFDDGLFMNALDADSDGVEGKFYTWTYDDLIAIVPASLHKFFDYFFIKKEGNWEHANILHQVVSDEEFMKANQLEEKKFLKEKNQFLSILFHERAKRTRPATDRKKLLSWNALMNIAVTEVYKFTKESFFYELSKTNLKKIMSHFIHENSLYRIIDDDQKIVANADDWALLLKSIITQAIVMHDEKLWNQAKKLYLKYEDSFSDEAKIYFYFSDKKDTSIKIRKIETYDGALPSVNAVMCDNLWILGMVFNNNEWIERSWIMMQKIKMQAERFPDSFSYWAKLLAGFEDRSIYIICNSTKEQINNYKPTINDHSLVFSVDEIKTLPIAQDKLSEDEISCVFICNTNGCQKILL